MVRPKLDAPQVTIAEDQEEFLPITAALVRHRGYSHVQTEHGPVNTVVLAFKPNADELARLAAGEELYVSLLTFGRPMPGIIVCAGVDEVCGIYNVPREVPA